MAKHSNDFGIFNKILSFVQGWPRLTLFGFVILLGFSAYGLKFSKLELDIYDVYDPNFQSSIDLSDIKDVYSDKSQMLVAFQFKSIPQAHELCRVHRWSKDLLQYEEINNITSLWSLRAPKNEDEKLWYPKLFLILVF